MSALTYKKNEDLESGSLDKMTVFQECIAAFNASPVQSKKCRNLLAKLIHLIAAGETFPQDEATSLFFSITKLFQHKDASLRQMVYLAVKELSKTADDVIMVTSSIMKDVQNNEIYKPNAIRALVRIIDASIVQGIERLMKTAIVDNQAPISSAALVSSYHLIPIAKDVVKRWANETQEAVLAQKRTVDSRMTSMTQYHALGLLYHLRSHDKMALMKMIQQLSSGSQLRNSNAIVMLIRYISKIIQEDSALSAKLYPYLEGWLRHKSDIVNLEAAKNILQLKNVTDAQANNAITVLQAFLASPRTVSRFSAIRILNRFAMIRPQAIVSCNLELENLINDPSRSIATYAITTLLKTGNEASVDRLMTQMSTFMTEISDEFKIIVIDAIRSLALKFPAKHSTMLNFIAGTLRNEGGINFKTAVVEALFDMITYIPESSDEALGHLCEFIEDCEFTELTVRILHLLGTEGPKTAVPTLYIRYIYNRVVLENAVIRAAAVTALAKFALVDDPKVQQSVKVLLTRCLDDVTDEVRDRAALSLKLVGLDKEVASSYISPKAMYSIPQLEHQLTLYVSGDDYNTPFDITSIATVTEEQARLQALQERQEKEKQETVQEDKKEDKLEKEMEKQKYAQELLAIPEIASYGNLLKSSAPVSLTENEAEYVVSAIKHVFKDHLVIQYQVTNTFHEYVLENVRVKFDDEDDPETDMLLEFTSPIDKLVPDATESIYVSFQTPEELYTIEKGNQLKFISKEIDPTTNEPFAEGYDDDYSLESVVITAGDFLVPAYIGNFDHQWDELPAEDSSPFKTSATIEEVVRSLIEQLSMTPLESTDIPQSESSHTLKLFGKTINGEKVSALIKMVWSSKSGVTLKATVRAESEGTATFAVDSIGSILNK